MKTKIIMLLLISCMGLGACDQWLNVSSNTEIVGEEQFKEESGFKDALTGVYIGMAKKELYSQRLTWHFIEYLSQQYAVINNAHDIYLPRYRYDHSRVLPYVEESWSKLYNLIANINNALKYIDRNKAVLNPVNYRIIKGELLGLRAFFHLDLLRMFGFGNLGNRMDVTSKFAIPYVTQYDKNPVGQLSYGETLKLLQKDLAEAVEYLKEDPAAGLFPEEHYEDLNQDGFYDNRRMRMNYYAVKGLQARAYLWEGTQESKEKALKIAGEVIREAFDKGFVEWVEPYMATYPYPSYRDMTFSTEHLFTLRVEKLMDILGKWLDASNPQSTYDRVYLTEQRAMKVFEVAEGIGRSDFRFTSCLDPQGAQKNNYATIKLQQFNDQYEDFACRVPLIRISEMYYIAAECYTTGPTVNLKKAIECLNTVREHRGIGVALEDDLDAARVMEEIKKEYMKEFVSEGQLFYFYKRLGMKNIEGYAGEMTDKQYMLPYPELEVTVGNRVQF